MGIIPTGFGCGVVDPNKWRKGTHKKRNCKMIKLRVVTWKITITTGKTIEVVIVYYTTQAQLDLGALVQVNDV